MDHASTAMDGPADVPAAVSQQAAARADDVPANRPAALGPASWTSFRNSPQQLGIAHTTLPDDLQLLWERDAPDGVPSTPAIAGGRVYVGILAGFLYCLELETGDLVWSYRTIESNDLKDFAPGFQAPVTVTDDLVIAGDEDGTLHAVDRATGKPRWTFPTAGEVIGGATILGDTVIFGSHGGKLYRLKLADGEPLWEFETRGPVNGAQAIGGAFTFVTGCDQPILRVVDIDTGVQHRELPIEGLLVATPALRDDILYFGTTDGFVCAIDWQANHMVWKYSDPNRVFEIRSSPAVTEDLVLIGSRDKRLHALDRKTGEAVWTFTTRAGVDSSPVVCGDRVYFGSSDKNIYGLTIADGREVWKYAARQPV
ncbi:MAG: PQQ-binding-like beta-propeller repeat protein, partial [Planctomycetaceae bacterium]|nr:PQQ-binding-like beta-propeller repeat protein [Planctomycetaceae bacterium]